MKLEQQITSLGLSIKLKKFGVKQESLFYWEMSVGKNPEYWKLNYGNKDWEPSQTNNENIYSAFTIAELGEILGFLYFTRQTHKDIKEKWVCYDDTNMHPVQLADTESNARAKMLIYLLQNKL